MQSILAGNKYVPKRVIIDEDANHKVVQFMNMEGDEATLEFNAGAPLSEKNKNYLLRHGRFYNLPERLRRHIAGLGYPKYGDVEVPGYKGAKKSTVVGTTHRFALLIVEDPSVVVIEEHEKDKIALKKLPGADDNTAVLPGENMQTFVQSNRLKEVEAQNEQLYEKNSVITDGYNTLSGKYEEIMGKYIELSDKFENLRERLNKKKQTIKTDTKKVNSKKR